ncbi:hypothetical protein NDU88_007284 [Pleurodeles waltl]|uniref:Uncharacterized protein n=1 Tax=Pleurodeles waltl TaxID=8319 RepID=A0AAV7QNA8_PLEWA|nr:hypothetical protein NDU88_007284 [Pleurodeles waltl]
MLAALLCHRTGDCPTGRRDPASGTSPTPCKNFLASQLSSIEFKSSEQGTARPGDATLLPELRTPAIDQAAFNKATQPHPIKIKERKEEELLQQAPSKGAIDTQQSRAELHKQRQAQGYRMEEDQVVEPQGDLERMIAHMGAEAIKRGKDWLRAKMEDKGEGMQNTDKPNTSDLPPVIEASGKGSPLPPRKASKRQRTEGGPVKKTPKKARGTD